MSSNLFTGTVASGATIYVTVPIREGRIGAFVGWLDATSSAAITLELTSIPGKAPGVAGAAVGVERLGETYTGPAATAAGSLLINVDNVRQKFARIKIVAAAACAFQIYDGTAP